MQHFLYSQILKSRNHICPAIKTCSQLATDLTLVSGPRGFGTSSTCCCLLLHGVKNTTQGGVFWASQTARSSSNSRGPLGAEGLVTGVLLYRIGTEWPQLRTSASTLSGDCRYAATDKGCCFFYSHIQTAAIDHNIVWGGVKNYLDILFLLLLITTLRCIDLKL